METKPAYRVRLYGKKGCSKCSLLKDRLTKLLSQEEWRGFNLSYCDISTEEGLVAFVQNESLNPQRIPSVVVEKKEGTGEFRPIANPQYKRTATGLRPLRYLGIETDYSTSGKGVITPAEITAVLKQARAA